MQKEFSDAISRQMEDIDQSPDSFEAIVTYGTTPLTELGRLGKEMLRIQGAFNEQINNIGSATLDSIDAGIRQILADAKLLGVVRTEVTAELDSYVAAGEEVLKLYSEKYIPEAQAVFKKTKSPRDKTFLEDVRQRKEDLSDRLAVLKGSSEQSGIAGDMLSRIVQAMEAYSREMPGYEGDRPQRKRGGPGL